MSRGAVNEHKVVVSDNHGHYLTLPVNMENSVIVASAAVGGFIFVKNSGNTPGKDENTVKWSQYIKERASSFYNLLGGGVTSVASSFRGILQRQRPVRGQVNFVR